MTADGRKWQTGEYKYFCGFRSDGRGAGDAFTADDFPTRTRDGAMLITSAEDPDDGDNPMPPGGHAGYCSRMHSAKARLFPVKPAAGAGMDFGRIR